MFPVFPSIQMMLTIKVWVLLNRAPSSTQLHPPPPSSFQPPTSSLQHPQQYLKQNIAFNWAISPNLGRKIKSCPLWLKIDTIVFWRWWFRNQTWIFVLSENWCTKCLKDTDSESRLRFLKFWPQNPFLGKFGPKKSKMSVLSENWYTWYLKHADSYSNISFLNFKS